MVVLNPLKVTITNYPKDKEEVFTGGNNPEDESAGSHEIPFSGTIYIEKEDFMENASRKYNRLTEGREVRLKFAYFIKCNEVIKDENGEIIELKCTYDPETIGGSSPDGRKVKGTIHWVSGKHAIKGTVNLYDRLFAMDNPEKTEDVNDFTENVNKESLKVIKNALMEPYIKSVKPYENYQFLRMGYFAVDKESTEDNIIFNRTTTLRDTWAKISKK
jgi:glutaminyl-tRNA synthetase